MQRVLTRKFFERPVLKVAREMLGKFLCSDVQIKTSGSRSPDTNGRRGHQCYMITEVEAYDGFKDKASHAHRGKTARNFPMFGEAGRWYVYFTYGMHWMLNVVTGPKNHPAAVLIRGVTGIAGPARITKFLQIDKKLNNFPATRKTGLWIENRGVKSKNLKIKRMPRIGVSYAEDWAKKKYRFIMKNNEKRNFNDRTRKMGARK